LRAFAAIVEAGPDRETDGVVRWRRVDLKRVIAERFDSPPFIDSLGVKLYYEETGSGTPVILDRRVHRGLSRSRRSAG
jgi:hypothetical protein